MSASELLRRTPRVDLSGLAATQFGRRAPGNTVPGDSYSVSGVEQYHITGASKGDVIYAPVYGHDDILIGNGGDDFFGGGGGSDTIRGGEGNDSITANGFFNFDRYGVTDGHDVIDGGPGDDVIEDVALESGGRPMLAAGALLQIDGGPGFDKLSFNFSNQTVPIVFDSAAPSNLEFADGAYARNFEAIDAVITGSGNDTLIQPGRVNNSLWTGPGDDVINPGIGIDFVVGGPGIDLCIVDYSAGDDPGLDGVTYNEGYRRYLVATPFTQVDFLRLYEIERVHFTGTSKADTLFGGSVSSVLLGRGGDDTLTGSDGDDQIEGNEGNDTMKGNGGSDQLDGGEGDDKIYTRHSTTVAGNGTIFAGPGNDLVSTEFTGQPTVGYGSDTIEMGEGDDEMVALGFGSSFGPTYALAGNIQRYDGGPGNDIGSADFGNQSQAITFIEGMDNSIDFPDGSYYRHFERLRYMVTGSGNDRIILTGRVTQDVSLREGNDVVNMGMGVDMVFGGAGEDSLVADWSLGDDASIGGIYFNAGNASLARNDTATNAIVDRIIAPEFEHIYFTGGSKDDVIVATNGSDVLKGMRGSDQLRTYEGDDLLLGCDPLNGRGAGEVDQLTGDGGADVFVLGDADGRFYDDGNAATAGPRRLREDHRLQSVAGQAQAFRLVLPARSIAHFRRGWHRPLPRLQRQRHARRHRRIDRHARDRRHHRRHHPRPARAGHAAHHRISGRDRILHQPHRHRPRSQSPRHLFHESVTQARGHPGASGQLRSRKPGPVESHRQQDRRQRLVRPGRQHSHSALRWQSQRKHHNTIPIPGRFLQAPGQGSLSGATWSGGQCGALGSHQLKAEVGESIVHLPSRSACSSSSRCSRINSSRNCSSLGSTSL